MVNSPPLVSLQAPKDVSIEEIEAELQKIWQSYGSDDAGLSATRAATFSLIVYEPEETQQLLAALGFYTGPVDGIAGPSTIAAIRTAESAYGLSETGKTSQALLEQLRQEYAKVKAGEAPSKSPAKGLEYVPKLNSGVVADEIAASNPCRIVTLCPMAGDDVGVSAQVSAYCPVQRQSQGTLVCCEYITLTGTAEALDRIGGLISALMLGNLPKFVWWKATPDLEYGLFQRLVDGSDVTIIDSSTFKYPEQALMQIGRLTEQGVAIADLNWRRLSAWQELTAEAFDPPERRSAILEVDRVTIDYEKGNQAQAMMYLGWLASRLEWKPVSFEHEGGDYDIRRIKLSDSNDREVHVELAGIPAADVGDIPGDLISLRLSSTNLNADCCTVLCSETTGCMRMEAGGGAQSCRIEQVTPLFDQKTEQLLAQQLRRWGREALYEESMNVTREILKLAQ